MSGFAKVLLIWMGALFWLAADGRAELRFDSMQLELAGLPSDKILSGAYAFQNTGSNSIRILGVKTLCGCTAAKPTTDLIPPGGRGGISVNFKTIGRNGVYETPVTVKTDDPQQAEVKLILRADVRDLIQVRPALLFWKSNEERAAKSVEFLSREGAVMKTVSVKLVPDSLEARVEELRKGSSYRLIVIPRGFAVDGLQEVVSVVALADGSQREIRTKVRVVP